MEGVVQYGGGQSSLFRTIIDNDNLTQYICITQYFFVWSKLSTKNPCRVRINSIRVKYMLKN